MAHGNQIGIDSIGLGNGRNKGRSDKNDSVDVQTKSENTIPLKHNRVNPPHHM